VKKTRKKKQAASQAQKAKPVTTTVTAKKPSWCWRIFCCCCKSSTVVEDGKGEKPDTRVQSADWSGERKTPKKENGSQASGSSTPVGAVESPEKPDGQEDPQWLLDPQSEADRKANKKTLVLDLDETLVHSSFTYIPDADFIIEIELDGAVYKVYVRKRPGVDEFMKAVGEKFEVVIFTASLAKYADPLLDILDKDKVVSKRLFREACVQHYGNYVKDLSLLGRKLEHSIIVDNSPFSYMFQPDNAIPITSWFNDKSDTQLYELLPFLDRLIEVDDVSTLLAKNLPEQ